jgi:CheY-like chemotaxis protein
MSAEPKLILCVEDDEDDCQWIEEAAQEIDPRLVFVAKANGREALAFLNRQKEQNYLPCLILLDINMPVMDGRQTLIHLKNDELFKKIPVVVFTTSSSKADQNFCEENGVDIITKPNRISELKSAVRHLVLSRCI